MVRVRIRIRGSACYRASRPRSPPLKPNPVYNPIKSASQKSENDSGSIFSTEPPGSSDDSSTHSESKSSNRIMVVVDSSQEAKGALQWALTHAVQKDDTIVLLHIANKLSKTRSKSQGCVKSNTDGFLHSMTSFCEARRPGVNVDVETVTGKERGPIIVEKAKKEKVSLLVLGQRRRSIAWRFLLRWVRRSSSQSIVDYCIQNADCMTVAVRRKSRMGGYIITTKRHKKFWVLA